MVKKSIGVGTRFRSTYTDDNPEWCDPEVILATIRARVF